MYSKGMLERYADTISDASLREEFRKRIAKIQFERSGDNEIAVTHQVDEAFGNSRVEGLLTDFKTRMVEFLTLQEAQEGRTTEQMAKEGCIGLDTGVAGLVVPRVQDLRLDEEELQSPSLSINDFFGTRTGDILFEGVVHFTTAGTRNGLKVDCEYVKTDDGLEFFDNKLFRGFYEKRIRVTRGKNDKFVVTAL